MDSQLLGIHHITAIAADPQRNVDFYTGVLGLRLVKQTVNFDDPGTYHLYYGDDLGRPGTILTFFPFPGVGRGYRGPGQVTAIAFSVGAGSLGHWAERLKRHGVTVGKPATRLGEEVLSFTDPDGLPLEFIARGDAGSPEPAIAGFHGATLWVRDVAPTARLLTETMGFRAVQQEGGRVRYAVGEGGPGAWVDLVGVPDAPQGLGAAGTVHHIAWRTPDDAQQLAWREALIRAGSHVTPVRDRQYFRSIYFREPGGVLFEIATDPPGFAIDEEPDELGTRLKLPPWLEQYRAELVRALPPLRLPDAALRR